MTSQQIEYVLTVAELRSFSKAAQKLFVTQPSLSQYIIAIEKQLGVTLFDRSTSPIKLTPAGEIYIKAAEKMKAIEDSLTNELSDMANLQTGSLKIGASTFRTSCLLSRSIAEFYKRYKGISIYITEHSSEQLKNLLRNSELDLIIGTGEFDAAYFRKEELARERLYLAVPKSNPINEELADYRLSFDDIRKCSIKYLTVQPVALGKFKAENFICAGHGEFGLDTLTDICEKSGFKPTVSMKVNTIETAFSLVFSGLGVALIPDTLIHFGNYMEHPYYYMLDETISSRPISLVFRKNGYLSNAAKEYCLTLKKLIDIGTWRV